jgi:hypothetical protein
LPNSILDIDFILKQELTELINMVRNKEMAFKQNAVDKYYKEYMNIAHNKIN